MKNNWFSFVVLLSFVFINGCSQRLIDFTMISSKNIDLTQLSQYKKDSKRVEGVDKTHIIFFIPTGVPNAKEALDRAIESVPGAVALVDGVITHHFWWIPYIYGQSYYVVEGTPLINPAIASNINYDGKFIVARLQQFPVKQPAHKNQPVSWIPRIIFRKGFLRHFHCAWAEYFLLIYNCLILL